MGIAREVANELKKINEIKAIGIYGSFVRGISDKYSDVDIVCFCSIIPSEKSRKSALKKLDIKMKKLPGKVSELMDYFNYKNREIGIWYDKLSDISKATKRFKKWMPTAIWKLSTEEKKTVIGKVYYSRIIYDTKGIFRKLKKGLPKADAKWINWPLESHLNGTVYSNSPWGEFLQTAIDRKDFIAMSAEFASLAEDYVYCLSLINGEYYMMPKWALKSIRKMKIKPKNCEQRLSELCRLGNDEKSINKKRKILKSLVDDLNEIVKEKGLVFK